MRCTLFSSFFFFNDTATTEIYTLSLHDALPIFGHVDFAADDRFDVALAGFIEEIRGGKKIADRKSTRLNSSHDQISYAVFCLKKKKKRETEPHMTRHTRYTPNTAQSMVTAAAST